MAKLLKAAVLGGLVVFAWGSFSWTVLPWHNKTLHGFQHDADVASVLDFAAPVSGIYVLPSPEQMESASGRLMAFVSLSKTGLRGMGQAMAMGLVVQILGAFLATWLLSHTSGLSYKQKILFVTVFGFAAGWLGNMPNFIWWNFPPGFTMVNLADAVIGWALAGAVIGKFV